MATTSNTIGLNVSGIEKMKSAVSSYKAAIKKKADIGAKKAVIEKAIKGTKSEASLKSYCVRIEDQINSILRYLDAYTKYLDTLADTYKKSDSENKSFEVYYSTLSVEPNMK